MKIYFEAFCLDSSSNQLIGPNGTVQLRPQLVKVLLVLLENPCETVTTEDLLEQVWGKIVVSPSTLAQCIRELRKELGDDAQNPKFIQTAHRVGYRWICDVNEPGSRAVNYKIYAATSIVILALLLAAGYNYKKPNVTQDISVSEQQLMTELYEIKHLSNNDEIKTRLNKLQFTFPHNIQLKLSVIRYQLSQSRLGDARTLISRLDKSAMPEHVLAEYILLESILAGQQSQFKKQLKLTAQGLGLEHEISRELRLNLEVEQLKAHLSLGVNKNASDTFKNLTSQAIEFNLTKVEHELGTLHFQWLIRQSKTEEINLSYHQLLEKHELLGDSESQALIKLMMISYLFESRQYVEAQDILDQLLDSIDIFQDYTRGHLYQEQMLINQSQGKISLALSFGKKAEKIFEELGTLSKLAGIRSNMALIYLRKGEPDIAESYFQGALESFIDTDNIRGQAIVWGNLSALQKNKDNLVLSIDYARLAVDLFSQVGDEGGKYRTLFNLARTEIRQGDLLSARQHLQQGISFYQESGKEVLVAHSLCSVSYIDRLEGKLKDALEHAENAYALSEKHKAVRQMITSKFHIGQSYRLLKNFALAKQTFQELTKLSQENKRLDWEISSIVSQATAYNDEGKYALGLDEIQLAVSRITDKDDATDRLLMYYQKARSHLNLKQMDQARKALLLAHAIFKDGADLRWQLHLNLLEHQLDGNLSTEYQYWLREQMEGKTDWELTQQVNRVFSEK